ncbi:N-acetylglucosamine kinase [Virgibacillus byunsanensis]|uniref:N-acetylglucosamine kinase n=1 Tax=Virgibacillus byunsanensis TaxID=570945 RepID=A0ABW3LQJ9_9BACI
MGYVMGIDGGGTKTIAMIADMDGNVVAVAKAGATNPNVLSRQAIKQTFHNMLDDLKKQASSSFERVDTLFAGISGAGSERSQQNLKKILKEVAPHIPAIGVEPDTINALYSGTYGEPGIVQIAGTGSITYGINSQDVHERVGGWGYLFGDEGSGYDIGRRGVIAALKAYDGRGADTMLLNMMYQYFDVTNPRDLIETIYAKETPKNEISPLSKIVLEAYQQHDAVAKDLLIDVVDELSNSIKTLYKKLFADQEGVTVVLCGGIFSEKEILPSLIINKLQQCDTIKIVLPKMSPVGGALIGAYMMRNRVPSQTVIDHIVKSM